ncbi:MAG: hypothetical protein AAB268_03460 [Elusimicrobiota bacterium]
MRIVHAATGMMLLLALAPLRAEKPALTMPQACDQLVEQAFNLTGQKVICKAGPGGLTLSDASDSVLQKLKRELFPEKRYRGHNVVVDHDQASLENPLSMVGEQAAARQTAAWQEASERLKKSPAIGEAILANFDNDLSRSGFVGEPNTDEWALSTDARKEPFTYVVAAGPFGKAVMPFAGKGKVVLVGGPPGSGGNNWPPDSDDNDGPPGSGDNDGPPGSGGNDGPPGSGGKLPPGNGGHGSTPPSRPAPVWRSNIPAPVPTWWNTNFNYYEFWDRLPSGYNNSRKDTSDPNTFYYYSGWYRWRDVFSTEWERTQDRATISRTAQNQGQIHSRSLTSEVHRESKECYYQAVYRYDWSQGGIYGSHWEESFDHYKARCIRLPREYGRPKVYTAHVSFDVSGFESQDLPWESDVIGITYGGKGRPRYDFKDAAYKYVLRVDDEDNSNESVTLIAENKILRAPESDKVQAFLRVNAGKVELVVNDDRTSYYQGETLRVMVSVTRRIVYKVKGRLWGTNEKTQDTVIQSFSPVDILTAVSNPQTVTDLTSAANAVSAPANLGIVSKSVFIDKWEFSRVNSRVSTDVVIKKKKGNSIDY